MSEDARADLGCPQRSVHPRGVAVLAVGSGTADGQQVDNQELAVTPSIPVAACQRSDTRSTALADRHSTGIRIRHNDHLVAAAANRWYAIGSIQSDIL